LNGTASGGGYELAIACDEIYLVDDGNSAVSLPEVPLLGVLPGTGGLTRLVDKRKIRRDRADVFSTLAEGLKGKRAKEWGLIDDSFPTSKFQEEVDARVEKVVSVRSGEVQAGSGIKLSPLQFESTNELTNATREYKYVTVKLHRESVTRISQYTAPKLTCLQLRTRLKSSAIATGRCALIASWTICFCTCGKRTRDWADLPAYRRCDRKRNSCRPDAGGQSRSLADT